MMRIYKVMLTVLCLCLLLSLCACVEAKADGQEQKAASPGSLPIEIIPPESEDTPLSPKTPMDEVEDKEHPERLPEKSKDLGEDLEIGIGEDYDPGLIPVPKPVEPPVEVQSEESSAAEE